jgi:hypothetical protein
MFTTAKRRAICGLRKKSLQNWNITSFVDVTLIFLLCNFIFTALVYENMYCTLQIVDRVKWLERCPLQPIISKLLDLNYSVPIFCSYLQQNKSCKKQAKIVTSFTKEIIYKSICLLIKSARPTLKINTVIQLCVTMLLF